MLYTDSLFITANDINYIAPDLVTELAASQFSTTITNLAQEAYSQCSTIIASQLQSVIGATNFNPSGGATSLHNAAIIWGVRAQSNVVRLRMGQIVINDLYQGDGPPATSVSLYGPLRSWLIMWACILGYRKMVGRVDPTLDRYRTKYDFLRNVAGAEKWAMLRSTGLPYVRVPFPAPGALYEPQQGIWSAANLTNTALSGPAGGTFTVAITWVDQSSPVNYISPTTKNNCESGPSLSYPNTYLTPTIAADNVLTISIASLIPPTGNVNNAEASITGVTQGTRIATGWNVYVGSNDPTQSLYLQNAVPIPVTQQTYTLASDPVLAGYTLGPGQYPDANMPMADLMMRM